MTMEQMPSIATYAARGMNLVAVRERRPDQAGAVDPLGHSPDGSDACRSLEFGR
jgi:hypothetical protein